MGDDATAAVKGRGRPRVVRQHSAGGLVVRGGQVLLIATAGATRWQLPKGRLEAGETAEMAAVREVREETGVTGRIVAALPGIDYWFAEGRRKRIRKHVDYFLLEYVSGSELEFDRREADDARWFTWPEALAKLTHANERRVATSARQLTEGETAS